MNSKNGEFQMTEDFVKLNVHEIGILLSALRLVEISDERIIARDYGSAPALYNKLYSIYEQMDKSTVELRYDFTPSF
jgi:hypothetical protein